MAFKNDVHKGFVATPLSSTDIKGNHVDLDDVLDNIKNDVIMITELAEWSISSDAYLVEDVDNCDISQANEAGRVLGITIDPVMFDGFGRAQSRYSKLLCDRVVREARSWLERIRACEGASEKYISQGHRRTVSSNAPSELKPKYSLSAGSNEFSKIINNPWEDDEIHLKMVVKGNWHILKFKFDSKRFSQSHKITLPDVTVDDKGNVRFHFTAAYEKLYPEISSRYIIGVDVGITTYASVVVWDTEYNCIAHATTLSQRVHSLHNSIRSTSKQVTNLQKYDRKEEAELHRSKNVSKKRELAILASNEIAELSYVWDNAVVVFEDLGWIENTMSHGRWNRGELMK